MITSLPAAGTAPSRSCPGLFLCQLVALAAAYGGASAAGSRVAAQVLPSLPDDSPAGSPINVSPPAPEPDAAGARAAPEVLPSLPDVSPAVAPVIAPPPTTQPTELPSASAFRPVEIHGFASQGFILTTGNDYLAPDTTRGSFQFSEVGINFATEFTDKVAIGVQAFAQNIGASQNFNLRADWFYVAYRWRDWLRIRAGRLQIPFGLYNEVNDIDAARAPILLPQSVYPLQGREFLFAQTGGEAGGFVRMGTAGALDYRVYGGTIFIDPAILVPSGSDLQLQLYVPYVLGGRLLWETPVDGLRLGASILAIRLDVTAFEGGTSASIVNHSLLAMGSAEYAIRNWLITAEYSRWHAAQDSALASSDFSRTSERSYAMLSFRATPWFQPTAYYALYFPDVANRGGGSAFRQDDMTLSLRFDAGTHWIIKVEGHYMSGTAGLVAPLSVTPPPANPADHWGVFLVKTTGYF